MNNDKNAKPTGNPKGKENGSLSNIGDDILKGLETVSGAIAKLFVRKVSFEEYLQATGDVIDEKILVIESEEKIKFYGGSCIFNISDDMAILNAKLELYFQNAAGKWIKKEQGFSVKTKIFNSEVKKEVFDKLPKKPLKITVDPPERKSK